MTSQSSFPLDQALLGFLMEGASPLPFDTVNDSLIVDSSSVPDAPTLSALELVRLSLGFNEGQSDSDDDGLMDDVEDRIGTDPHPPALARPDRRFARRASRRRRSQRPRWRGSCPACRTPIPGHLQGMGVDTI